jgi:hypothetical protein
MAQHREFAREITVYVWRFHSVFHCGHAAVKITGIPGLPQEFQKDYISWWPGKKGGLFNLFENQEADRQLSYKRDMKNEMSDNTRGRLERHEFLPRVVDGKPTQRVVQVPDSTTGELKNVWGQEADVKIKLPARGGNMVGNELQDMFGLDAVDMFNWWFTFRNCPHPKYKFASKHTNCAGVAALALMAGGAHTYADPPAPLMSMTPNQIERWALEIKDVLARWNQTAKALNQQVAANRWTDSNVEELFDVDEWKTLSNLIAGNPFFRSDKIRKIDDLLKKYHRLAWSAENAVQKRKIMGDMMDVIHQYLAHKPQAKRRDAVVELGMRILRVVSLKLITYNRNPGEEVWWRK